MKAHKQYHEGTNKNAEGIFIREWYITSLSFRVTEKQRIALNAE